MAKMRLDWSMYEMRSRDGMTIWKLIRLILSSPLRVSRDGLGQIKKIPVFRQGNPTLPEFTGET